MGNAVADLQPAWLGLAWVLGCSLTDIKNKRQHTMIENMMRFNLTFTHISGTSNAIADCLSRITRRREAQHVTLADPIFAYYAVVKKLKGYKDNIETDRYRA